MTTTEANKITFTQDQQNAFEAFFDFLANDEPVFVISGFAGCGKSTLVKHILEEIPKREKVMQLIKPDLKSKTIQLTATTNKAAENLSSITGMPCSTIHSFLGIRVSTDYKTGETKLVAKKADLRTDYIIFIDEASWIDPPMLKLIFSLTDKCKIVFIGDPAQLVPIKMTSAPVFSAGFTEAALKEVVRQANTNPIQELATSLRNTVNTGEWTGFKPDGNHIQHMDMDSFLAAIEQEFTRKDWKYTDSKILTWTNKRVVDYNGHINSLLTGNPQFQEGDYAICNSFVSNQRVIIKTDATIQITKIRPEEERHGVKGHWVEIDHGGSFFYALSLKDKQKAANAFRAKEDFSFANEIEQSWIDLRAAFAQTVNKSQGSTYGKVFIDLNDIGRCNSGDQLARMLYVATSRASNQVIFTGDIV